MAKAQQEQALGEAERLLKAWAERWGGLVYEAKELNLAVLRAVGRLGEALDDIDEDVSPKHRSVGGLGDGIDEMEQADRAFIAPVCTRCGKRHTPNTTSEAR